MIFASFYMISTITQPQAGAIGKDTEAPVNWLIIISTGLGGMYFLIYSFLMFVRERRRK